MAGCAAVAALHHWGIVYMGQDRMSSQHQQIPAVLRQYWGFDVFRPGQREVVEAILDGRHVLAVMPTGAGKSLCYQLPALMLPGVALVVSPLIALMKDQVDQLRSRGVAAAFLNSTQPFDEQQRVLEDARTGHLKLLYVAPERFRYEGALARLKRLPISLFAVDEAHCISHWGHDFRPDYQALGSAFAQLAPPRLGAFTATATSQVRSDIVDSLGMRDPMVTVAGFARDNLHLSVLAIEKMNEKPRLASKLLKGALADGGVAVVYCSTRKNTEAAAQALGGTGLTVVTYHGGMDDGPRKAAQEAFQSGSRLVIVATNAFGMGVDKPDVRLVLHWDFPSSLDAYYQEVGRAGRDGKRAYGVMLFTYADMRIHEFLIEKGGEDLPAPARAARAEAERHKLKAITRWAYIEGCRHGALLRYFGDRHKACDLDDAAGSRCDRCCGTTGVPGFERGVSKGLKSDGPTSSRREGRGDDEPAGFAVRALSEPEEIVVQKALSAVARANGAIEAKTLAKALRGSRAADVLQGPLAATKSFGILAELPEGTTLSLLKALAAAGCTAGRNPTLTPLGVEVMWRRSSVKLAMPPFASGASGSARGKMMKKAAGANGSHGDDAVAASEVDETLLRALKERRMAVAKERGVAAFIVASNALIERIAVLPIDATRDAWLAVKGIGEQNVEPLRDAFAKVLSEQG